MQRCIGGSVVSFLEKNIGPYLRIPQLLVIFNRGSCNIDVHAANAAIIDLDGIHCFDRVNHIVNVTLHRVFACFNNQALMTQTLQHTDFIRQFILAQLPPYKILIGLLISAVFAVIDTIVAYIQRSKQDDSVAVYFLLDHPC
ncbi:hypothetical protein D3C75_933920 [compost metagenome]